MSMTTVRQARSHIPMTSTCTLQICTQVPAEEPWPRELHGYELGRIMRDVRLKGYFIEGRPQRAQQLRSFNIPLTPAEHKAALLTPEQTAAAAERQALIAQAPPADALLLQRNTRNADKLQQLLAALRAFREISGPGSVRVDFVVPSGESLWPERVWGVKLGARLQELKKGRIKPHLYGAAVCDAFVALGIPVSYGDAADSSSGSSTGGRKRRKSSSSSSSSNASSDRSNDVKISVATASNSIS
jgi:hypothetical protein